LSYPEDRKYTESHEWVLREGDTVTIGITAFASESLGELVYVEPPEEGDSLNLGDECGVVESVKAASDLLAPVSGEVVEVNNAVVDEPRLANDDPYGAGWLLRIKLDDPGELDQLLTASAYQETIGE